MKVLKSVMKGPTRQRSDTNPINVFHVNADAISYWDSTVYGWSVCVGETLGTRDGHAVHWS